MSRRSQMGEFERERRRAARHYGRLALVAIDMSRISNAAGDSWAADVVRWTRLAAHEANRAIAAAEASERLMS